MHSTSAPVTPSSDQDSGSFLTGFTIGLFAGAAGYFLFGTNRGSKIRDSLSKEWEEAQKHLTESQGEQVGQSIGETLRGVASEVSKKIEEIKQEAKNSSRKTTKTAPKRASTPKSKKVTKFKGV